MWYFQQVPILFQIPKKTAETTKLWLQQIFPQYSLSKWLFTDSWQPFTLNGFALYLISQLVQHITLSWHYPKSYGFMEKNIKTVKEAISKTNHEKWKKMQSYFTWGQTHLALTYFLLRDHLK